MRSDARALLQKLNQQGFQYQQFPDPYADLELWPIFEALLNDERVVGQKLSRVQQRENEFQVIKRHAAEQQTEQAEEHLPEGHPLEEGLSALLSTYAVDPPQADGPAADAQENSEKVDLRTFLGQLGGKTK